MNGLLPKGTTERVLGISRGRSDHRHMEKAGQRRIGISPLGGHRTRQRPLTYPLATLAVAILQRVLNVNSRRRLKRLKCARSGRYRTARRTGKFDPLQTAQGGHRPRNRARAGPCSSSSGAPTWHRLGQIPERVSLFRVKVTQRSGSLPHDGSRPIRASSRILERLRA